MDKILCSGPCFHAKLRPLHRIIDNNSKRRLFVLDEVIEISVVVPALTLAVDQEISLGLFVVVDYYAVLVFVVVHFAVELPFLVLEDIVELAVCLMDYLGGRVRGA